MFFFSINILSDFLLFLYIGGVTSIVTLQLRNIFVIIIIGDTMNNKKVKKLIILAIAILTIVGLGGLFAYLTDTDQKTNVFTIGSIKIELVEPNWNPSNGQNILPGQPINKNPKINNIGNNPAYVYIKVVNPIVTLSTGEGPLFNYTTNSGWTQLDQVDQCGYRATTYYYNTAINPSSSTTTLFDTVTINDFTGDIGEEQLLDIYAYGIQSTYLQSGSTVTSIFSDAFTTTLSDTDESCPIALDCSNNEMYTTAPSNLKGLAKIMAKNAYLDNGKSEYVTSCSGVDFSNISSDANGKGIYEIASTKNDPYPIYYYRGAVDNNNVKFAGFCWKVIRTTDTGGVKLIYNGEPDGSGNCTNTTGASTQIGTSKFNNNRNSAAYVGYMYGTVYTFSLKQASTLTTSYVYGGDVTYSGGTYTLTDTITSTGDWSTDRNSLINHQYTCFSTGSTCSNVYYIYYGHTNNGAYYITLSNGKKIEDALNDMFNGNNVNENNSTAKTTIENWYSANISSYTSYIEDTIYCNDRSIDNLGAWNPTGGTITAHLDFSSYKRSQSLYSPSLACSRGLDKFTVSDSIGNGALTYPVGLITSDEVMYAGGSWGNSTGNNTYYLYTNQAYWTMSPGCYNSTFAFEYRIWTTGSLSVSDVGDPSSNHGLRPVVSLKSTDIVESGDGTQTNPYIISTN